MSQDVPLYAIPQSVLDTLQVVTLSDAGRARDVLDAGVYAYLHQAVPAQTIPPMPVPVPVSPPVIATPASVGQPVSTTPAVWPSPPAGLQIQIERRIVVNGVDRGANYTAWQPIDSGLSAVEQSRARFIRARPGGRPPENGPFSEWGNCQSAPVTVTVPQPVFTTQPSFGAASYTVGSVLALNLGAATNLVGAGAGLFVEVFSLGAADKRSELIGSGATRSWDSTGETAETVSLRVRATNPAGSVLSNTVTVPLTAAAAALSLSVVQAQQVFEGVATGTTNLTWTGTPGISGTISVNADAVSAGPMAVQAASIVNVSRPGQSPAVGDEIGFVPGQSAVALAIFDPGLGSLTETWRWQRDTVGNGVGLDIAGGTPTRVVQGADGGSRLRLIRRVVQGANTLDIPSAWTPIIPGAPVTPQITVTGATDGILFDGTNIVASVATDGILVSEV